jgi:hypothetical protein
MAECKFDTLSSGIEYPDPLSIVTASRGIFIGSLVKLGECHVLINPSRPSLSNTSVTVAKANKWINPNGHKIDEAGMNFKYITRRMK